MTYKERLRRGVGRTWVLVGYSATWGGVDPVTSKSLGMEHVAAQNSRHCLMVVPNSKVPAERTVPTGSCTEALRHLCPTICEEVGEGGHSGLRDTNVQKATNGMGYRKRPLSFGSKVPR